jgi:hypothetical protein
MQPFYRPINAKTPKPPGRCIAFARLIRRLKIENALGCAYALNELPQPQVDFTFGLENLNPEPSSVST